jgi:Xaa-Pro aminopeptidase
MTERQGRPQPPQAATPSSDGARAPDALDLDQRRMRAERLARARAELVKRDIPAALLFDPLNIRYTTASGFAVVSSLHYVWRWALVPVESDPIVWDYESTIPALRERWPEGEIRKGEDWHFFLQGTNDIEAARGFAREIADVLDERGIEKDRIGLDRCETTGLLALQAAGLRFVDAQQPLEVARSVKTQDEVQGFRRSARVVDAAIAEMRDAIRPGVTENELFATLTGATLRGGGEYNEGRLVVAGQRTNPWLQEASDNTVRDGDLVAFDTDLVGPDGFLIDVSRTYLAGDGRPSSEQRELHAIAYEFLQAIVAQLRPGRSFAELGRQLGRLLPAQHQAQRYGMLAHGVGMQDEWPVVKYEDNYDGEVEVNMVLSAESYVGAVGGTQGVKLEEQLLVTESGCELLSVAPYDERLT